ncbi:MAG: 4Fe-4S dicluster domain-containing protein [Deltaproteobacteria bacterium]|nr:4Fe-4S dicluster domain-containing protein [Deltaproteobacteria bacterium]
MADEKSQTSQASAPVKSGFSRRKLLRRGSLAGLAAMIFGGGSVVAKQATEEGGSSFSDTVGTLFQDHYQKMSKEEIAEAIARIERQAKRDYGADIKVGNEPPIPGVVFGYALNVSKCKGVRKCVEACMAENNQSRDPQIQYIRVLELDQGGMELGLSNHYFDSETVPAKGKWYLPVQCHQCENPPCTNACPVGATWKEPDGVIVVDYNWCIGCRFCMAACPYWARRFNWADPKLSAEEINTDTHYLSNRPRYRGVVEKCTYCLQRTRKGRLPACLEACPTGARVFGNLLDPNSDIRYVLENKTVFRLKSDLGTDPKFWYFSD